MYQLNHIYFNSHKKFSFKVKTLKTTISLIDINETKSKFRFVKIVVDSNTSNRTWTATLLTAMAGKSNKQKLEWFSTGHWDRIGGEKLGRDKHTSHTPVTRIKCKCIHVVVFTDDARSQLIRRRSSKNIINVTATCLLAKCQNWFPARLTCAHGAIIAHGRIERSGNIIVVVRRSWMHRIVRVTAACPQTLVTDQGRE